VPLTPLQAQKVQLRRSANGYDCEDVDRLLEELAAGHEQEWLQRIELRRQLDDLLAHGGSRRRPVKGHSHPASVGAAVAAVTLAFMAAVAWQLGLVSKRSTVASPAVPSRTSDVQTAPGPKAQERGSSKDERTVRTEKPGVSPALPASPGRAASPARPASTSPPAARARSARLVLTAARGDCWLLVRAGSSRGNVLYVGTLVKGRSLRFAGTRFWIRFGSSRYLDLRLAGRRITKVMPPTGDAVVTTQGVRILATS